jgi:oligopeptide transport system ATP-binding protein
MAAEIQPNHDSQVLVEVQELRRTFNLPQGWWERLRRQPAGQVVAVAGVSLQIAARSTVALVGESGCGKSTTGRCILRLIEPSSGRVYFDGQDVLAAEPGVMRRLRRRMQIVFQDPYSSLNPRMTVEQMLKEVLAFHHLGDSRAERRRRVLELLHQVGLDASHTDRYPHEFSGGQRQRIGIARALAVEPQFIICDEPVSALDVSVQAQIINLLEDLQAAYGLTYLFIAHDLSVVHHISDRVAVMYLGQVVEEAPTDELFTHPHHPYTQALLAAIPRPDPARQRDHTVVRGELATELAGQRGCPFRNRCPFVLPRCQEDPAWQEVAPDHHSRCWLEAGG